jgi:hypothetical protein
MPTNHISLIMTFVNELKDLALIQMWIDGARITNPTNQHLQLLLDRKQAALVERKDEITDQMFEISRSN